MNDKTAPEGEHCILIVDDAEEMRLVIAHQLRRAGYRCIREASSAGEVDYIIKPVDRMELIARVRSSFTRRRPGDETGRC